MEDDADVQTANCQYVACSGYGIGFLGLLVECRLVAHCHGCDDGEILFPDMQGVQLLFRLLSEVLGFQDGTFKGGQ